MDRCFVTECEKYAVTPVLMSPQVKCCESAPIYVPCCNDKVVYCCKKIRPCTPVAKKICYDGNCDDSCTLCSEPQKYCPTCRQPTGPKPAVKYVMPCYRYEDGRIVEVMPSSALKRNGIQDHKYTESGGVDYLCQSPNAAIWSDRPFYMPIKPLKRIANTINQPTCLTKHACKVACSYCPTPRMPTLPVQCLPCCEPRKPSYVQRCKVPDNCCTACLELEK